VFRKGVWRRLIFLAVSFRVGGGRGVVWGGRLARGDTSRETDYWISAMAGRLFVAAYLAFCLDCIGYFTL